MKAHATFKQMSQRVISATESLGKAMGFGVSAEGLDGLDGEAMGFRVSAEGPGLAFPLST